MGDWEEGIRHPDWWGQQFPNRLNPKGLYQDTLWLNYQKSEKVENNRKQSFITCKGVNIIPSAYFSAEICSQREWHDIFKILEEKLIYKNIVPDKAAL